ncbi:hypothetical protein MES5069_40033 [Mesorhizobium escarrei]|uniref:Uncharacterized protein n=1 Tax=Mesorhizobium escarrei TaxID=666018 RepID=A0ABM9E4J6_9HYPH|nr:hypothetical protein MES5069_40033 [Mesorhizobium escarrei]
MLSELSYALVAHMPNSATAAEFLDRTGEIVLRRPSSPVGLPAGLSGPRLRRRTRASFRGHALAGISL